MRRVIYLPILSLVVIILTYSASAQDQKSYSFGDKRDEVSESALPFTSFKFTPNVIDATTSSQTVTLDVQGLNTTYTSIQVVLVNQIWNLSNTLTFNEPSYSTSIAAYSANGTWIISSVTIDAEEMRETYSAETLVSNGFNISQIFVKSIFELNPPSIISVYTTINEVNTSVSSQFVTLYMYASDDDCGLRSSYSFSLSITDSFPNSYFGIFNQVSPGFYSATMEIECCTQSGELKIYAFSVSDNCGNSFLYQGNNVSITVNSNPDLVEPVMDYIKWIGSSYDITQAVPDEMGVIMNLSDDRSGCTTSITYNFSSSFFDGFRSFTPQLSNSNTNKLICNFTTTGSSFTNQIVSQLGMKWKGNGNFTLHEIKIQDRQRNIKTYTQQQLENDFNMITDFEIISLLDDTPPIVFSVDLPDVVLKTKRKSSSSFNLTVTSSDDLSGLSTVSINMENGRISQSVSGSSYNGFLGLSTKTLQFTLPGQYNSSIDSFAYVNDITITDVASNRVVFPIYRYVKLQDNAACYPDIAENNRVNFFPLSFPLSETELNFCGSTDEDNYDIKIEDNNSTDFTQFVSIMIKSSGRSLNIEALIFNKTNPTQSIGSVPASTANYNFLQLKLLANETYTLKIKRTGSLADFPYSLILSECELTQFDCMEIGLLDLDSCECLNSTSTTGVEEITTGTTIITTGRMTTTSSNLNVQSSDEGITGGIIALIVVFGVIVPIITILVVVFLLIRRRRQKPGYNDLELKGLNSMKQVKDILLQERIGGGNFGVVWKGIMEGTIPVALKQRKSDAQLSSSDDNSVLHEATVLNMLNHKNIVLYYGVYIDIKKQKFMVTEFLPRGSLVSLLQKEGSQFDQKTLLALCYDVAMGLKYLKSRRVIHRDLAARNILVADSTIPFTKYVAKIADFGMSYKLDESSDSFQSDSNSVAAKWAAPEVLKSGTFSFASEVWSFGVIMWEIYSFGGVPLYGLSNQDVVDIHQRDEEIILDKPDSCPDHLYKILVHCMKKNITERITIEGVCDSLQTEMEKQPDFRHVSSIYQNVSTTKQQQFEIDETVYN